MKFHFADCARNGFRLDLDLCVCVRPTNGGDTQHQYRLFPLSLARHIRAEFIWGNLNTDSPFLGISLRFHRSAFRAHSLTRPELGFYLALYDIKVLKRLKR